METHREKARGWDSLNSVIEKREKKTRERERGGMLSSEIRKGSENKQKERERRKIEFCRRKMRRRLGGKEAKGV